MGTKLKYGMLLGLLLCGQIAIAQIPPGVAGVYTGSGIMTNYINSPKGSKAPWTILLTINENGEAELTAAGDGQNPESEAGTAAFAGGSVFVKFPSVDPETFYSGRLSIKGKAGKQSLAGKVHLAIGGVIGLIEFDMKLKQIQPEK